jgi:hypothetical protein
VPEHAPDQALKKFPAAAEPVSVTAVPRSNVAVQVDGQLIPAGVLTAVPLPDTAAFSWNLVAEELLLTDEQPANSSKNKTIVWNFANLTMRDTGVPQCRQLRCRVTAAMLHNPAV